jgi:hypothetical protein
LVWGDHCIIVPAPPPPPPPFSFPLVNTVIIRVIQLYNIILTLEQAYQRARFYCEMVVSDNLKVLNVQNFLAPTSLLEYL